MMNPVQNDSKNRWKPFAFVSVIVALTLVVVVVSYRSFFTGLTPEACGYAQLSRNIAQGQGMQNSSIPPLGYMVWHSSEHTPDLMRPPLYAVFQAGMFKLFHSWDRTALLSSTFWFLSLVAIMMLFACRIVDRAVCITAGLFLVLWPPLCYMLALSAMPFSMGAVWWMLAWVLLLEHKGQPATPRAARPSRARSAAIGLCLGLCILTQTSLWIGCLVLLGYMIVTDRWASSSRWDVSLGAMLIVLLPWMIRQIYVAHTPFYSLSIYEMLMDTPNYPGDLLYRLYTPGHTLYWCPTNWSELLAVLAKWMRNLQAVVQQNGVLMAALPLALIGAIFNKSVQQIRLWLVSIVIVAITMVVYAFGRENSASTSVLPYLPMLVLMAVYGIRQLCEMYDDDVILRFQKISVILLCSCFAFTCVYVVTNMVPPENPLRVGLFTVGEKIVKSETQQLIGLSSLNDNELRNVVPIINALTSPKNALERALANRLPAKQRSMLKAMPSGARQSQIVAMILNDSIRGGTPLAQAAQQIGLNVAPQKYQFQHDQALDVELPWQNRRIIEAYFPKSVRVHTTPSAPRSIGFCDQADLASWYTNTAWIWLPESSMVNVAVKAKAGSKGGDQMQVMADDTKIRDMAVTKASYLILSPDVANTSTKRMKGWFFVYQGIENFLNFRLSLPPADREKLDYAWLQQSGFPVFPQFNVPCQNSSITGSSQRSVLLPNIVVGMMDFRDKNAAKVRPAVRK